MTTSTSRSRCDAASTSTLRSPPPLQGRREPRPVRSVVGAALRHPFGGLRVIARIRLQGIRLWLRRVPIVPRPDPSARGRPPGGPSRADRRTMTAPLRSVREIAPLVRGPWQHVGDPPDRKIHAAIARSLFFRAVAEHADPGAVPRRHRRRRGWRRRAGDDAAPARRLLPPRRERRADRIRRVVHGRRLGRRRPRRHARAVRRAPHQVGAGVDAAAAPPLRAAPAVGRGEHARRRAPEHRAPLRPVERPLRALPRRLDDVLVGVVHAGRHARDRAGPEGRPAARRRRRRARHPHARDRHRLGLARDPRRASGRDGHDPHPLPRAAGPRPSARRRRRASAIASTCNCATTAMPRASTTRS